MVCLLTVGGVQSNSEALHHSVINLQRAGMENTKWLVYGCCGGVHLGQQTKIHGMLKVKMNGFGSSVK